tara:strand:- start:1698 stop:2579 length:882 start_codon:yes stop_codon:yes gene_type:complete
MNLSERSVRALEKVLTGDPVSGEESIAPYRSGPNLVDFFVDLGENDVYGPGFGSRRSYTTDRVRRLIREGRVAELVGAAFNPAHFLDDLALPVEAAVEYFNRYVQYDGLQLVRVGQRYQLGNLAGQIVEFESPFSDSPERLHVFVEEQIAKCEQKLGTEDFDGAITNARSLVESILVSIDERLNGLSAPYGGDLKKLFSRVSNQLNLRGNRQDIPGGLREVISGLRSIVGGLAAIRNTMSDAHSPRYRASRHHARLAVNSAKTVADFLCQTFEYQKLKGTVLEHQEGEQCSET